MPGSDPSTASKLDDLKAWLTVPTEIETLFNQAQENRDWMEDCLLRDHEDTVVTHHVLRNQEAKLAHLTATKPSANVKPRKKFYGPPGMPEQSPPELVRFGETLELLLNWFADHGKLRDAANAAARDADTVRAGWVKRIWRDDPNRTPIGTTITDEGLLRAGRYRMLRERFRDGKFGKDDAEYESMMGLEERLRSDVIRQLQEQIEQSPEPPSAAAVVTDDSGQPVPVVSLDPREQRINELLAGAEIRDEELADAPRFLGFDFDVIDIEDIRLDWSIDKPEFYYRSRRIGHRTRMTPSEISARYELDDEQQEALRSIDEEPDNTKNPKANSTESVSDPTEVSRSSINDGKLDVWEVWDRVDGMVYVFSEKTGMLAEYVPRNTGPHWFPFFYLWFHESSGRIYAPSSVDLQRDLQDELNSIRTHGREYRKAALPRLLCGKGAMTEEEIDKFESSHPFQVIEVENPDDIRKTLFKFDGVNYNPSLVSTSEVFLDLQITAGMPTAGIGGVGNAKLATEVAFAGEMLNTQIDRQKYQFNAFLERIFVDMAFIIVRSLPYENALAIAGPGMVFPLDAMTREQLVVDLQFEIITSPTGIPDVGKELEHLQLLTAIFNGNGVQVSPEWLAGRMTSLLGIETDWQAMIGQVGPLPQSRPAAPSDGAPTGQPTGPAPGTPSGGFTRTPTTGELPGGQTPDMP